VVAAATAEEEEEAGSPRFAPFKAIIQTPFLTGGGFFCPEPVSERALD
jgi:hypothetical protein